MLNFKINRMDESKSLKRNMHPEKSLLLTSYFNFTYFLNFKTHFIVLAKTTE